MDRKRLLCYRKRALFPLGLAAVAILAAGLAFMFGGGQNGMERVEAQSGPILVSNIGQDDSSTAAFSITDTARAQPFRTGSETDGYILTQLDSRMTISDHTKLRVSIHADGSFKPGAKIGDFLTGPTANNSALATVSFTPQGGISLAKEKWYWAVFECTSSAECAKIKPTASNSEDDGPAAGWSISDASYAEPASGNWTQVTADKLKITVRGFVASNPVPDLKLTEVCGSGTRLANVNWGEVSGATKYKVEWYDSSQTSHHGFASLPSGQTTEVTSGTSHQLTVPSESLPQTLYVRVTALGPADAEVAQSSEALKYPVRYPLLRGKPVDSTAPNVKAVAGPKHIRATWDNMKAPCISGYWFYWAKNGEAYDNTRRVFSPHVETDPYSNMWSSNHELIRDLPAGTYKVKVVPTTPSGSNQYTERSGAVEKTGLPVTGDTALEAQYNELKKLERAACSAADKALGITNCHPYAGVEPYYYAASIRYGWGQANPMCSAHYGGIQKRFDLTGKLTSPVRQYIQDTVSIDSDGDHSYDGLCSDKPPLLAPDQPGYRGGGESELPIILTVKRIPGIPPPPAPPIYRTVTQCFTQLGELTGEQHWDGEWYWSYGQRFETGYRHYDPDLDCNAHHREGRPARYLHFTLNYDAEVSFKLEALQTDATAALYVSKGTPKKGWGTPPENGYDNRVQARMGKGTLLHGGRPEATLTLPAGNYTAEAAATSTKSDTFTLSISRPVYTAFNDPPVFDASLDTTLEVAENSPAGTNVGLPVTATDPDAGDTLTYYLVDADLSGTDAASFEIGAKTGQITTKSGETYDYETKSSYSLTVGASDGDGQTDTIAVTVSLTDVNEAPSFAASTATRAVAENSAAGTSVGAAVTATDPDSGDTLTYSLSGTDASSFAIGASTGQITTKSGETYDYETDSSYSLTVEATDDDGLSASIAVTINLTNVEETTDGDGGGPSGDGEAEEPANRAPAFAASTATRSVAENSAGGVNVGAAVTATDPDAGDTLTYSLSGTDAASFEIGASTGQITTKTGETYDYEAKSSYSLTVEATDDDGLSDSIAVTVNLTDVDEAPTVSDRSQFKNHAATVGEEFSLTLPAADANSGDGGPYEYLLWHRGQGRNFVDQAVNGLRFDATTRTLSGTPAASGVWQLSYVVHDDDANRSVADRFRARTKLQITVSE